MFLIMPQIYTRPLSNLTAEAAQHEELRAHPLEYWQMKLNELITEEKAMLIKQ
jgi:hypothetical protein